MMHTSVVVSERLASALERLQANHAEGERACHYTFLAEQDNIDADRNFHTLGQSALLLLVLAPLGKAGEGRAVLLRLDRPLLWTTAAFHMSADPSPFPFFVHPVVVRPIICRCALLADGGATLQEPPRRFDAEEARDRRERPRLVELHRLVAHF